MTQRGASLIAVRVKMHVGRSIDGMFGSINEMMPPSGAMGLKHCEVREVG